MRLIDSNFCTDSITEITPSSQRPAFPASNLKNPFRSKRWRSVDADTEHWVRFDFKTIEEVNSVVVMWPREDGVLLSETAEIRIQANATDVWTSPAIDQELTLNNDYSIASHFFEDAQEYRYWRLVVTDVGNANDFVEVGIVVIGQSLELQEPENGFGFQTIDQSKTQVNDYGHVYVDEYPNLRSIDIDFAYMNYDDIKTLQESYNRVGTKRPVLLALDPDESVFDKDHFLIYGKYASSQELTHVMHKLFDSGITIVELG